MPARAKRVALILDEELVDRLKDEAQAHHASLSAVVQDHLARDLGASPAPSPSLERIRDLRDRIGPMPDSTPLIRRSRDSGR